MQGSAFRRIFVLSKQRGGTEEPLNATLLMAFISLLVLFVGNLNTVAPIVVMPFLTTYAVINYAYFAMEMSLNIKACKISRNKAPEKQSSYGTLHKNTVGNKLVSASKEHITFFDARNELCLEVTAHDSDRAPLLGRSVDGDEVDSLNQSHQPQPAAVELGNLVEEPVAAGYACEQEEAVRKRQCTFVEHFCFAAMSLRAYDTSLSWLMIELDWVN